MTSLIFENNANKIYRIKSDAIVLYQKTLFLNGSSLSRLSFETHSITVIVAATWLEDSSTSGLVELSGLTKFSVYISDGTFRNLMIGVLHNPLFRACASKDR